MFQTFDVTSRPEQGPPRLAALRLEMAAEGLDGFLVPRADAHQGEYVAPCDERLAWLTGFTGSAGFCAVLRRVAAVFVDGRYRTQVKHQVAADFTPVDWPDTQLGDWLRHTLPNGGTIGFDPWLHTAEQVEKLAAGLSGSGVTLQPCENLVDRIWTDRPGPPTASATSHALEFAGESHDVKRARLAETLRDAGHTAALITLPDSLCWLLNLRGTDIPRNPIVQGFCLLSSDASVRVFIDPQKLEGLENHLGPDVKVEETRMLIPALEALEGPVRLEKGSVPLRLAEVLGDRAVWGSDPCALPKACKNSAEIEGSAAAHLRDGAAVTRALAWLDAQPPGSISEIDIVRHLEALRREDPSLRDISFDTIAGTGPNGAIMHYRVSDESNATLEDGQLLVLDSGGQYLDGTTDITRTIAIGTPPREAAEAFTRVLKGMIGMSRLHWPAGHSGRELEAVGRLHLWVAGQDFNHGLGHGVGAYLSVHEGPQRLSRVSTVPLQPGMILSNEPGYYREGAFGIRIENLIVVVDAPRLETSDPERAMLCWRTLTFAPIDRRLIVADMLETSERAWLNDYHAAVLDRIGPLVPADVHDWLAQATAPL